jgi:hypothetical protein
MAQSIEELEARLAAVEARLAAVEARLTALEAKVKPSAGCIYADQQYGEGSVVKQGGNVCYRCDLDFTSSRYQWKPIGPCQ